MERLVCYSLSRVLSAVLCLRAAGCPVSRLRAEDVLYIRAERTAAWCATVRASVVADICLERHAGAVCDDAAALLQLMLRADPASLKDRAAAATPRAAHSRALLRAARLLAERTWHGVSAARDLLEFVLWGPPEGEARIAAMGGEGSREAAFRAWLDVARCRALARLVLEPGACDGEVADQVGFLCRVTDSTLIEVTKHLFQ